MASEEHYKLAYEWYQELKQYTTKTKMSKILNVTHRTLINWEKTPKNIAPYTGRQKRKISEQKLNQAQLMIEDGASFTEISKTINISRTTLNKYFPGKAWTKQQILEHLTITRKYKI